MISFYSLSREIVAFCVERGGDAVARELAATAHGLAVTASRGPTEIPRAEDEAIAASVAAAARCRVAGIIPLAT